ncbi:uncharacterized protein LOC129295694 [Prosopis cineraria]|uniref:uncharacterized protein LOC129295694 n=1 Tax=Prosopis cineraria TaxID=364024 RepID=UPI00240F963F|nr:uncharacterized protein LOC129295694 [Prosopis cineraria]
MRRRKERQRAKVEDEEDLENDKMAASSLVILSSDDEEANEDLTLKIEEKAQRMREAKLLQNGVVVLHGDGDGDCGGDVGLENEVIEMKNKKKNVEKIESGYQIVITSEEQERSEAIKASETNESPEASTVQMSDNSVLRKLLRGPRYFDPPDSNWGTCFNCGEGGHTAVNCKAGKRKKPCFVCGSLEHAAKKCTKARYCFICKKSGHRANDCPEKTTGGSKSSVFCFKCGNSGHDMFQCKNSYSSDDLKEIQCYVCKAFGHLCCVDSDDGPKWEVSCYKCGQLGHTGLACSRLREETTGATTPSSCFKCGEVGHFARECTSSMKVPSEETTNAATPSSCFACGEEGHFARECTSSSKARKKNRQLLKSPRSRKEKDFKEYGSAPPDMGKAHKRKKIRNEDIAVSTSRKSRRWGDWMNGALEEFPSKFKERGVITPKKSKRRGGWMNEDPGDYASPKSNGKWKPRGGWITEDPEEHYPRKFNRWMTPPATPPRWKSFNHAGSSGSNTFQPRWNWKSFNHAGSSGSKGSTTPYQPRFSSSRFDSTGTNPRPPPRYDRGYFP